MSMHGHLEEKKDYQKINDSLNKDDDDHDIHSAYGSMAEAKNKSNKRKILMLVILGIIVLLAVGIVILVLILKSKDHPEDIPEGYNGYTISSSINEMWYYEANLTRTKNYTHPVPINNQTNPEYSNLTLRVSMMNDKTFRIKVKPMVQSNEVGSERWEIPDHFFQGNTKDDFGMRLSWGNLDIMNDTVGLEISDQLKKERKFISTKKRNFCFSEYYIEMGFLINSRKIFGFGERTRKFELGTGEYTSWSNGRINKHDSGKLGNNSYGDHPFVLSRLNDNSFVGIYFRNSNAKVLSYSHVGNDKSVLDFKAIGGILDFFIFADESAEGVIKAYHQLIGVPYLPPFWALGFHQSSSQYNSTAKLDSVLKSYEINDLPLEAIWVDREYMEGYRNFLVNTSRYEDLAYFSTNLQVKNQKLIVVIDAGLKLDNDYLYYRQASENGLLIKSIKHQDKHNGDLIGKTYAGESAFVDFVNPQSTDFWINALRGLYTLVKPNGFWLDMNEITTFCDEECPNLKIEYSNFTDYPYSPTGDKYSIKNLSLSLDGQHYYNNEKSKKINTEYNLHSLYGHLQAKATSRFWVDSSSLQGKRPFVLSRSTFAGTGNYASHWLGENSAKWEHMQYSIAGIMNFNMFGIPLVGADICGNRGTFDQEM